MAMVEPLVLLLKELLRLGLLIAMLMMAMVEPLILLLKELLQLGLFLTLLVLAMVEPLILLPKVVLLPIRLSLKGQIRVTEAELLLLMRGV